MFYPLYFGCWRETGHYWFTREMRNARDENVIRGIENAVDGTFCPPGEQVEGRANVVHLSVGYGHEPATLLAFWDRSVDSRGNSNSAFLLPGILHDQEAIAAAQKAFPQVFARFKFNVTPWVR